MQDAQAALENTTVASVSFKSPLEISLWVSSVVGSVSATAGAIITIFNRAQRARVNKADADMNVQARRFVVEAIEAQRRAGLDTQLDNLQQFIDGAVRASLSLEKLAGRTRHLTGIFEHIFERPACLRRVPSLVVRVCS